MILDLVNETEGGGRSAGGRVAEVGDVGNVGGNVLVVIAVIGGGFC